MFLWRSSIQALKKILSFAVLLFVLSSLLACSELNLEFEDVSAQGHKNRAISAKARAAYLAKKNRAKPRRKYVAKRRANKNRRYVKKRVKPRGRKRTAIKPYVKHRVKRRVYKGRHVAAGPFANRLSSAALGRLRSKVRYDGSYYKISYPNGDVPANRGVCTDVVIRSYRKLGIDLQKEVHKDMRGSFKSYPKKWGLSEPDSNIDHRRVTNLRKYFSRRGASVPVTRNPLDYRVGDIVTWYVPPGKSPHIGIVVNRASRADPRRKMIVHNINNGPEIDDILFAYKITGHYRYTRANL